MKGYTDCEGNDAINCRVFLYINAKNEQLTNRQAFKNLSSIISRYR